jgi:hypothetical protein
MKSFLKSYSFCFLCISISYIFAFLLIELFFRNSQFFIIFYSIPFGFLFASLLSLFLSLIDIYKNFLNKLLSYLIMFMIVFLIVISYGFVIFNLPPKKLINMYVTETMPPSIEDIRGVIEYPAVDHIIRIRFKIDKDDFNNYILKKIYAPSDDDFPYCLPIIKEYKWWNMNELKNYQQFKAYNNNGIQYLWYNETQCYAYFLRVRSLRIEERKR